MNLLTREIVLQNGKIKEDRKYSYNNPDQYYSFFECALARLEHLANSNHTGIFISKYEALFVEKNSEGKVIVKRFYSTQNIENLSESNNYKQLIKAADKADKLVLRGDLHNLNLLTSSSKVRTLSKQQDEEFNMAISSNLISLDCADTPFQFIESELLESIKTELEEIEIAA